MGRKTTINSKIQQQQKIIRTDKKSTAEITDSLNHDKRDTKMELRTKSQKTEKIIQLSLPVNTIH